MTASKSARVRATESSELERASRDRAQPVPSVGALTAIAWVPRGDLDLREWLEHGRRFGAIGRGVAWWLGDWLIYGNARYGERYTRAARATGYDPQSLMNMVYVASRFEFRRRRKPLSWSHHAEVAALPPDMQECWLDLAERERMSVRSLRTELRGARRASRGGEARRLAAAGATVGSVVCPRCNSVIELGGEGEPTPPAARLAAPILE